MGSSEEGPQDRAASLRKEGQRSPHRVVFGPETKHDVVGSRGDLRQRCTDPWTPGEHGVGRRGVRVGSGNLGAFLSVISLSRSPYWLHPPSLGRRGASHWGALQTWQADPWLHTRGRWSSWGCCRPARVTLPTWERGLLHSRWPPVLRFAHTQRGPE